jgi:hypothetical protein
MANASNRAGLWNNGQIVRAGVVCVVKPGVVIEKREPPDRAARFETFEQRLRWPFLFHNRGGIAVCAG